jgi:hypothetical protein
MGGDLKVKICGLSSGAVEEPSVIKLKMNEKEQKIINRVIYGTSMLDIPRRDLL